MIKTIVITGSTDGIGRAAAEKLLTDSRHRVVLHARSAERGEPVLAELTAIGNAELVIGDFERLDDVAALAGLLRSRYPVIDVLVNNAGLGSATPRRLTADGHDVTWQVNYLAPVLLTTLLSEQLVSHTPARIVNVSSIGHMMGRLHFDDLNLVQRAYPRIEAYCQSKLAMIMWSYDLADDLARSGVTVNALHPGTYVDTKIVRQGGNSPLTSLAAGAATVVHLAVDPELETVSGSYFDMLEPAPSSDPSHDLALRKRLRAVTFEALAPWIPPSGSPSSLTLSEGKP